VTTYYWIAIITMTVLSSAILIDGVRMQSEFEQLQRRGLPPPIGIDFQRIFKRWKLIAWKLASDLKQNGCVN
jgi:hypothetical protein